MPKETLEKHMHTLGYFLYHFEKGQEAYSEAVMKALKSKIQEGVALVMKGILSRLM